MGIINERSYIYPDNIVEKFSSESTNGSFEKEMEYCIYRHFVWKWPLRFQLFVIYVVSVVDIWKNDGAKTELVRSFRPEQDNALPASFFALSPRLVSFLAIIALTKSVLHNPAWNQRLSQSLPLDESYLQIYLHARDAQAMLKIPTVYHVHAGFIYTYIFRFLHKFMHKFFSSINDGHSRFFIGIKFKPEVFLHLNITKWFTW